MLDIPFLLSYQLPGLFVTILFLLFCEWNHKRKKEKVTVMHRIFILLLGCYITLLFSMTVSPEYGFSFSRLGGEMNLIPFSALREPTLNAMNFLGNVFLFAPLGILLVLISRQCRKMIFPLLSGLILSVLIELLQLFLGRGTDIDDVILNFLGTLFGYFVGYLLVTGRLGLMKNCGAARIIDKKRKYRKKDYKPFWGLAIPLLLMVYVIGFIHIYKNEGKDMMLRFRFSIDEASPEAADNGETNHTEAAEPIDCEIEGTSALMIDSESGSILFKKNDKEKIAPASTTKLLTAYTVLKYCEENEKIIVGDELSMTLPQSSLAGFQYGDQLTVYQLLEGLLLPSGSDAAYTLAVYTGRKIGGENLTEQEARNLFIEEMNRNAQELGMNESHFETVDGHDVENQYTTTEDLMVLLKQSITNEITGQIIREPMTSIQLENGRQYSLLNTNEILDYGSDFYCEDCIGGKTGNTNKAGSCLISAFEKNGRQYLIAVMGDSKEGRFADTIKLWKKIKEQQI